MDADFNNLDILYRDDDGGVVPTASRPSAGASAPRPRAERSPRLAPRRLSIPTKSCRSRTTSAMAPTIYRYANCLIAGNFVAGGHRRAFSRRARRRPASTRLLRRAFEARLWPAMSKRLLRAIWHWPNNLAVRSPFSARSRAWITRRWRRDCHRRIQPIPLHEQRIRTLPRCSAIRGCRSAARASTTSTIRTRTIGRCSPTISSRSPIS